MADINIGFKSDTSGLKSIEKAFKGLEDSVKGLSGFTVELAKLFDKAAKQTEKQAVAESKANAEREAGNRVLQRQKDILEGLTRSFSRGESGVLAMAKASGASASEMKQLEKTLLSIRSLIGNDPFDSSIGGIRRLGKELTVLEEQYVRMGKANSFSKKQIEELMRVQEQAKNIAIEQAKALGKSASETDKMINGAVKKATAEYERLSKQIQKQIDINSAEQASIAASNARQKQQNDILKETIKNKRILAEVSRGASLSDATFLVNAKSGGASNAQAQELLGLQKGLESSRAALQGIKNLSAETSKLKDSVQNGLTKAFTTLDANTNKYKDTLARLEVQLGTLRNNGTLTTANSLVSFRKQLLQAGIAANSPEFIQAEARFMRLRKEIDSANRPANQLARTLQGLSGPLRAIFPAIGAVGIATLLAEAAAGFVRMADAVAMVESRIKIADGATSDYKGTLEELFKISNENRKNFQDVANLYAKISPSLRKLGFDTQGVLDVTDAFTKTLRISKADTIQASAAILQFSQALASGRLQGDEFRSIAENSPEFLAVMSSALGKTTGELRKMSTEGQLTAEVISKALVASTNQLEEKSKQIATSIPDAFTILRNNITKSAGEINDQFKITESAANGLLFVAARVPAIFESVASAIQSSISVYQDYKSQIDFIISAFVAYKVGVAAAAAATFLLPKAIVAAKAIYVGSMIAITTAIGLYQTGVVAATVVTGGFTAAWRALTVAMAANPIGAIATAIGVVVGGLALVASYLASDRIAKFLGIDGSAQVDAERKSAIADIEERIKLNEKFLGIVKETGDVQKANTATHEQQELQAIENRLKANLELAKTVEEVDRAQYNADLEKQAFYVKFKSLQDSLNESKGKGSKEELKALKDLRKEQEDYVKSIQDVIDKEALRGREILLAISLGRELTETEKARLELQQKFGQQTADGLIAQREVNDANQAYLDLLKELDNIEKEKQKTHDATIKSLTEEIEKTKEEIDTVGKSSSEIRDYIIAKKEAKLESIVDPAEKARLEEEIRLLKERNGLLSTKEAKEASVKAAEDAKKEFEKIQDDIAKSITDAIADGGKKGSELLKNMLKAQVFRIFIEPVIRNAVGSVAGALGVPGATGNMNTESLSSLIGATATAGAEGAALSSALTSVQGQKFILNASFDLASAFGASTQAAADFANLINGPNGIASYAGSIILALKGDLKGAAGSAAGTYIGGVLGGPPGAAIGSFIGGKLFGGSKQATYSTGSAQVTYDSLGRRTSATNIAGGYFESDRADFVDQVSKQYFEIVKQLNGRALEGLTFGFATNSANKFVSRVGSGGQLQNLYNSNGEIAATDSNIQTESLRTIFGALKGSNFADNIDAVIQSVDIYSATLEQLNAALSDVQVLNIINTEFFKLGSVMGTLANQSIDVIKSFFTLAGGFEGLQQSQSAYISAIYSEEEQLALATTSLNKQFENLGVTVPKTTAEFRALVESQSLTTTQGQALYLSLLQLAPAFAEITKATEEVNLQVLEERKSLEEELFELTATSAELLQKQRDALDASNRGIFDQIQAIKARKEAEEKAIDTVTKAYENQKSSVEQVKDKFKGFAETLADYRNKLLASNTLTGEQQYAADRAAFNRTVQNLSSTDSAVREQAFADFTQVADKFLGTSKEFSSSYVQYLQDFTKVSSAATQAENAAIAQVSIQEQQLQAMDQMVAGIISVDNSVLTLAQALNQFYGLGLLPQSPSVGLQSNAANLTLQPVQAQNTQAPTRSELEAQLIILNSKLDQMLVENRAATQAVVVPLNKVSKVIERADDGDSINVRIVT